MSFYSSSITSNVVPNHDFGVADVTQVALVSFAPSNDASVGTFVGVCYKGLVTNTYMQPVNFIVLSPC